MFFHMYIGHIIERTSDPIQRGLRRQIDNPFVFHDGENIRPDTKGIKTNGREVFAALPGENIRPDTKGIKTSIVIEIRHCL